MLPKKIHFFSDLFPLKNESLIGKRSLLSLLWSHGSLWWKDTPGVAGKVCRLQPTGTQHKGKKVSFALYTGFDCVRSAWQIWPSASVTKMNTAYAFSYQISCHTQHSLEPPQARLLPATFRALYWLLVGVRKKKSAGRGWPFFLFMVLVGGEHKPCFIHMLLTAYKHSI